MTECGDFTLEEELELTKNVPECAMDTGFMINTWYDIRGGKRVQGYMSLYDFLRFKAMGLDVVVIE